MNQEEKVYPFKLFQEKLAELKRSGFIQNWQDKKLNISVHVDKDTHELEETLPSEDEIKSFILTLRFFIQDNEACSIRNLKKHYNNLDISQNLVEKFNQTREKLNEYLDSHSGFNGNTYRDIFDAYIYGQYAHSDKREKVLSWATDTFSKGFSRFHFISVLHDITKILIIIDGINQRALKELTDG